MKTKALTCAFVFAYAKSRFSHGTAHFVVLLLKCNSITVFESWAVEHFIQVSYKSLNDKTNYLSFASREGSDLRCVFDDN